MIGEDMKCVLKVASGLWKKDGWILRDGTVYLPHCVLHDLKVDMKKQLVPGRNRTRTTQQLFKSIHPHSFLGTKSDLHRVSITRETRIFNIAFIPSFHNVDFIDVPYHRSVPALSS